MKIAKYSILLSLVMAMAGCQSPYHRDQMALFGGLAGAGLGAALSKGDKNLGENAAVGAAIGAFTGAAVGEHMDEVEAQNQALFQQRLGRQLAGATTIDDVVAMSHAQLSDEVIRTHIANHGVARTLTAQDAISLKGNGVSDVVIQAMQSQPNRQVSNQRLAPPVIVQEHCYADPWYYPPQRHHQFRHHYLRHGHRHPRFSWGFSFSK